MFSFPYNFLHSFLNLPTDRQTTFCYAYDEVSTDRSLLKMIYLFYMPHEFALNAPLICKNNRPFCQKHFVEEVTVRTSNAKK